MFTVGNWVKFWMSYPSLLYGIASLLGFYASFYNPIYIIFPSVFLWLPFLTEKNQRGPFLLSLALFFATWSYGNVAYRQPELSSKGIAGKAHLSIQSLSLQTSPFGKRWIYACELKDFFPNNTPQISIASHVKCTVSLSANGDITRPLANQDYLVQGRLLSNEFNHYILKISPNEPWMIVDHSWSLAEKRYEWKTLFSRWIKNQFSDRNSGTFLAGLATGNFDDQWMRQEFARFGLQHIMAISGFHFAIIAGMLSLLVRAVFSRSASAIVLLLLMASYCFFLGSNASVLRAWLMCSITLAGTLLEKQGSSLNSLGVALIVVLVFDPLLSKTLAFQFSFLTTAAILLMFSPIDHLLSQVFVKRQLSEVIEMDGLNQHGYVVISFFRQALSLTLAVNLLALPLTLFYFHQFPVMGILYNFFFPFLITGSLSLLIIGSLFSFIPFLGGWINNLNNFYTKTILQFTYGMPRGVDHNLTLEHFPVLLLILWICVCCGVMISLRNYLDQKREDEFAFI
jgi:competence protein ComEC